MLRRTLDAVVAAVMLDRTRRRHLPTAYVVRAIEHLENARQLAEATSRGTQAHAVDEIKRAARHVFMAIVTQPRGDE